jgi:hypothetical protein
MSLIVHKENKGGAVAPPKLSAEAEVLLFVSTDSAPPVCEHLASLLIGRRSIRCRVNQVAEEIFRTGKLTEVRKDLVSQAILDDEVKHLA